MYSFTIIETEVFKKGVEYVRVIGGLNNGSVSATAETSLTTPSEMSTHDTPYIKLTCKRLRYRVGVFHFVVGGEIMKMFITFLVTSLLSFIGFAVAGFVASDVQWVHITAMSLLVGLLITWTFNPIAPFNFKKQH